MYQIKTRDSLTAPEIAELARQAVEAGEPLDQAASYFEGGNRDIFTAAYAVHAGGD